MRHRARLSFSVFFSQCVGREPRVEKTCTHSDKIKLMREPARVIRHLEISHLLLPAAAVVVLAGPAELVQESEAAVCSGASSPDCKA